MNSTWTIEYHNHQKKVSCLQFILYIAAHAYLSCAQTVIKFSVKTLYIALMSYETTRIDFFLFLTRCTRPYFDSWKFLYISETSPLSYMILVTPVAYRSQNYKPYTHTFERYFRRSKQDLCISFFQGRNRRTSRQVLFCGATLVQ